MSLDLNELRELLAAINQTDIAELTLKSADFELTVRRGLRAESLLPVADLGQVSLQPVTAGAATPTTLVPPAASTSAAASSTSKAVTPESIAPASESTLPPSSDRRWVEIKSPMVGTFYRSPAPDEPPFVDVGDRIRTGQTVCIIEAMKLMNELEAEISGEIVEILVQNGAPVEYNQPLMRINPL